MSFQGGGSTSLHYISLSLGFRNIDDRHRHPNIKIREIIWLGNQLGNRAIPKCKNEVPKYQSSPMIMNHPSAPCLASVSKLIAASLSTLIAPAGWQILLPYLKLWLVIGCKPPSMKLHSTNTRKCYFTDFPRPPNPFSPSSSTLPQYLLFKRSFSGNRPPFYL